jgi:uncharacterized protein (TIGR00369 family)
LRLAFAHEQGRVSTRFQFRPEHVGFKQTIHGGLIATVLDEAMVWACGVGAGQFAYSAEMTVRYLKPVRPNEPLVAVGEVVSNRRNRLFEVRGELRNDQAQLLAAATGKYLPVPSSVAAEFAGDVVGGDLSAILRPPGDP